MIIWRSAEQKHARLLPQVYFESTEFVQPVLSVLTGEAGAHWRQGEKQEKYPNGPSPAPNLTPGLTGGHRNKLIISVNLAEIKGNY